MKKIKLNGKLNLNKISVSRLNDEEINGIAGGKLPKTDVKACTETYLDACVTHPVYVCCKTHITICGPASIGIKC